MYIYERKVGRSIEDESMRNVMCTILVAFQYSLSVLSENLYV